MTAPVSGLPVPSGLTGAGGELVQSLTYREAYAPALPAVSSSIYDPPVPRRLTDAPAPFRAASGAAWALVSIGAAGAVLLVLVLALMRVVGWLT